ncbi:uncharacterized protein LOC127625413 [Xyrauchen texanus]|uniref:uncharacterized protein LOC127625413 n=1 Tax=Xyrauchen texanus TaxID=154827 RepID=UPI002241E953|nr:uncharacterized protein LOC127625413 [Xyrauchen texanus]
MFASMWIFILFFVNVKVGGEAGDVGTVTVMEGGVLSLPSGVTDLEEHTQVLWSFKSASLNTRVAQLYHGNIYTNYHERFSGRAQLDQQTGSLTISDIRMDESGVYDVFIIMNRHISERKYKVDVYAPIIVPTPRSSSLISVHQLKDVVNGKWDELKIVMEGEGLTLQTKDLNSKLKSLDEAMWQFGSEERTIRIAQVYQGSAPFYEEKLTDRLHLDKQTGSLTIWNISTSESGLYVMSLTISGHISEKRFRVDVYVPVSIPAIKRRLLDGANQTQSTSHEMEEFCSMICSVRNDQDVFISWYKGGEMLNQTRSSDLSINLSLPLHLHYNDTENYSCTAANPVSNKTIYLQMNDFCTQYEDCQQYCGDVEVVVRLVLSGLVGIASVVFLVEHVRFRGRVPSSVTS